MQLNNVAGLVNILQRVGFDRHFCDSNIPDLNVFNNFLFVTDLFLNIYNFGNG